MSSSDTAQDKRRHARRMPAQSIFYDRLLPIIFIVLTAVMIALIVIAAGVLLGFVHYR